MVLFGLYLSCGRLFSRGRTRRSRGGRAGGSRTSGRRLRRQSLRVFVVIHCPLEGLDSFSHSAHDFGILLAPKSRTTMSRIIMSSCIPSMVGFFLRCDVLGREPASMRMRNENPMCGVALVLASDCRNLSGRCAIGAQPETFFFKRTRQGQYQYQAKSTRLSIFSQASSKDRLALVTLSRCESERESRPGRVHRSDKASEQNR